LNLLERFARRLWARYNRSRVGDSPAAWHVLEQYVDAAPSPANAVGIFAGLWTSRFPAPFDQLPVGHAELFHDYRFAWALQQLGDVRGLRALELGPLEGGHTYMLDRAGAREIVAIEANTRAFLRCLVAKELLGIPAARFLCGNFMPYLRETPDRFDVCVASGVLYHVLQPVELLERIAAVSSRTYIWTHYYDEPLLKASPRTESRVVEPTVAEHAGFRHRLYRHDYGLALDGAYFCGGSRPVAYWLTRDDILCALRHFGFTRIETGPEQKDHPNGPAMTLVAWK
jgi:hypothetical protein